MNDGCMLDGVDGTSGGGESGSGMQMRKGFLQIVASIGIQIDKIRGLIFSRKQNGGT